MSRRSSYGDADQPFDTPETAIALTGITSSCGYGVWWTCARPRGTRSLVWTRHGTCSYECPPAAEQGTYRTNATDDQSRHRQRLGSLRRGGRTRGGGRARGGGGRTSQDQKANEGSNEHSGQHAAYDEGPPPRPKPHMEALIMLRTAEACAAGMVCIASSCHSHSGTCQTAEPYYSEILHGMVWTGVGISVGPGLCLALLKSVPPAAYVFPLYQLPSIWSLIRFSPSSTARLY